MADFSLPSWTVIEQRTFIECEIIGPANIYLLETQATHIPPPALDAVVLDPSARFNNGFIFKNCHLRGCSFHRVTVFVPANEVDQYKQSAPQLNWISNGSIAAQQLPFPKIDDQKDNDSE